MTSPDSTGYHAAISPKQFPNCFVQLHRQLIEPSQHPGFQSNSFTPVPPGLRSHPNALGAQMHPNTNTLYSTFKNSEDQYEK